jgi:hypothetical protein
MEQASRNEHVTIFFATDAEPNRQRDRCDARAKRSLEQHRRKQQSRFVVLERDQLPRPAIAYV